MALPTVSVFIVNWNSGEYLNTALTSLLNQTLGNFEAIVVDNASTDGSQNCLTRLADPRLSLLELKSNVGFAVANNIAASKARSKKYFALLNPDAFPDPDWLKELVSAAETEISYGAFSSSLVDARNTDLWDGTGDFYRITGQPFRRDHHQSRAKFQRNRTDVFSPCAAAALYTRKAWEAACGFDEDYFCYVEDVDLGFRLQLLGFRTLHVPEAICLHIGSGIVGTRSDFSAYFGQRNLTLAYLKNMPGPLLFFLFPLHLLSSIAAFFLFVKRGQGKIFWESKVAAMRLFPKFWIKRKLIQQQRCISSYQVWSMLDKSLW